MCGRIWSSLSALLSSLQLNLRVNVFAMLINQAKRRIEDELIDNFKETVVSAETVKNITGKMIRKMPKREHFQYRSLEFVENEFTSFARKAFRDISDSGKN
jgi:hypothetical protein